ncbi:MAG: methionine biosynthesis protein MetW [Parvibaculales bacterium]
MTEQSLQTQSAPGNISADRMDLLLIGDLIAQGSRVLDIGCGGGDLLALLKSTKAIDGRGLEISQRNVNACVSRGLAVVQGNADTDLGQYPDAGFDYAILSQTLQATQKPEDVLLQLARISRKIIVSIPNFGYWRVRLNLMSSGRMPRTDTLDAEWYNTPNIHLCTLLDFNALCARLNLNIERCILMHNGRTRQLSRAPNGRNNLFSEQAIYLLSKNG